MSARVCRRLSFSFYMYVIAYSLTFMAALIWASLQRRNGEQSTPGTSAAGPIDVYQLKLSLPCSELVPGSTHA